MKRWPWLAVLLVLAPLPLPAQGALDRRVTLTAHDIALQEALDRIAAAARLRFSYSAERLQLDRRVSPDLRGVTVSSALAALLHDAAVQPVLVGANHVVLAPRPEHEADPPRSSVIAFDRIVVTGSATGVARRAVPFALDVVTGSQLEKQNVQTLAGALLNVPGVWLWPTAGASLIAQYGGIRGASSFGLSYPKVYIDGIEVANPLLLMWLAPETVERIETIRGPQGAALYGADAISGVINIVTRTDVAIAQRRRLSIRSQGGLAASSFTADAVLAQDHAVSLAAGSNTRSLALRGALSTFGEYRPGVYTERFNLNGSGRWIGAGASVSGVFRLDAVELGSAQRVVPVRDTTRPRPPRLPAPAPVPLTTEPQTARQYTAAVNGKISGNAVWTHSLIAGVDGYRLRNVSNIATPFPSPVDSALLAARGGADRASVRLSSVANLGSMDRLSATVTIAAEHSRLRQTFDDRATTTTWRNNTGLVAQVTTGWRDALFATGGLRLERNSNGTANDAELLPMLGGAAVTDVIGSTLKLRATYGRGIRPARSPARIMAMSGAQYTPAQPELSLAPEEQAGIEAGLDWLLGDRLSLHLTRFDQRATGLIQQVLSIVRVPAPGPAGRRERIVHQLQNVGEIANRGWEVEARAAANGITGSAALTIADSRVERLARGYSGDLRVGDRMLGVPRITAAFDLSWSRGAWFASGGIARAKDWIGYDRVALAAEYTTATSTHSYQQFAGHRLREYWLEYNGSTRVRAVLSRSLTDRFTFTLTGENLLNHQEGEPDNATVVPGRTVTAGVKVRVR